MFIYISTISSSFLRIQIYVAMMYFKIIFGFNQAFLEMDILKTPYKNYKIEKKL